MYGHVVTKRAPDVEHPVAKKIRRTLADINQTQSWLGNEVAVREGRSDPYSQAAVSQWLKDVPQLPPSRIFYIEDALDLPTGTLSRPLGYLPAHAVAPTDIVSVIEADPLLDTSGRRAMIGLYRAITEAD